MLRLLRLELSRVPNTILMPAPLELARMHQVHLHQSQTKQLNTEHTNLQLMHAAAEAQQRAHQSQSEGDINQLDCALPTHDCSLPGVLHSLQRCQSLRCEG